MKKAVTLSIVGWVFCFYGCAEKNDSPDQADDVSAVVPTTNINLNADPLFTLHFERDVPIGNNDLLAIDESGRVFQGGTRLINVYGPDGDQTGTVGGTGSGPGEFRSMSVISPKVSSGRLFALDLDLSRINVYSLETLLPENTISLSPDMWQDIDELSGYRHDHIHAVNDTLLLLGFKQSGSSVMTGAAGLIRYFKLDVTDRGSLIPGQVLELEDSNQYNGRSIAGYELNINPRVPYTGHSLMSVSNDGTIYSAWSEEFSINLVDINGNHLHSYESPYARSSLNRDDILQLYNPQQRRVVQAFDMPETWPVLDQLIVDDQNNMWISTITDDEENYTWWVVDEAGVLLATFDWPGKRLNRHIDRRCIITVKDGFLYMFESQNVDGFSYRNIVRYKIEFKPV